MSEQKKIAAQPAADARPSHAALNLAETLQDIGHEFGCPAGIKVTDWLRVVLRERQKPAEPARAGRQGCPQCGSAACVRMQCVMPDGLPGGGRQGVALSDEQAKQIGLQCGLIAYENGRVFVTCLGYGETLDAIRAILSRASSSRAEVESAPFEPVAYLLDNGFIISNGEFKSKRDGRYEDMNPRALVFARAGQAAKWIPVSVRMPECNEKHGYSQEVLVSVVCGNGLSLVGVDRFDAHSKTWERYHTEYAYRVTHWQEKPLAAAEAPNADTGDRNAE